MTPVTPSTSQRPQDAPPNLRRGHLALALQELLTAIVRLRANRQVAADAASFRVHLKQLLSLADQDARGAGYTDEQVRFALYAVVAFLDESVLNSSQPMFSEWPRQPLQDEIFGGHMGGEVFFQHLQHLLAQPDGEDLADVLEVYQLCMLLGFHGRYTSSDGGELRMTESRVAQKIARIRGESADLSPAWAPPPDAIGLAPRDPWVRRLGYGAIAACVLVCLLFAAFHFSLRSGTVAMHALAPQLVR